MLQYSILTLSPSHAAYLGAVAFYSYCTHNPCNCTAGPQPEVLGPVFGVHCRWVIDYNILHALKYQKKGNDMFDIYSCRRLREHIDISMTLYIMYNHCERLESHHEVHLCSNCSDRALFCPVTATVAIPRVAVAFLMFGFHGKWWVSRSPAGMPRWSLWIRLVSWISSYNVTSLSTIFCLPSTRLSDLIGVYSTQTTVSYRLLLTDISAYMWLTVVRSRVL